MAPVIARAIGGHHGREVADLSECRRRGSIPGHLLQLGESAPRKENPRPFSCEGTSYRAADRTATSVDTALSF
jgi:hypothetical protein